MLRSHPSIAKLPDTPGVYRFLGKRREVLYVGKATSLRDRVRSYFANDLAAARGVHLVRMVEEASRVVSEETDSVLEALILEAKLIKELKPRYNTLGKDDTSWNYLVVTTNETYPRFLTVRGKDLDATLATLCPPSAHPTPHSLPATPHPLPVYGPFVHAGQFKTALRIIRDILPYYDTKRPVAELRAKHDRTLTFNEAIGLYPRAGTTPSAYARTVQHIRLFFEGKKERLIRSLEREMHRAAQREAFEEAGGIKRQIFALRHLRDTALMKREHDAPGAAPIRIEGYDVAHLQGEGMVGVMTVVEAGEAAPREYRTFTIRSVTKSNDTAALREVLERRLAHPEWQYPRLIVVDGGAAQQRAAKRVLAAAGVSIPVVAVTKDEHHRPKHILGLTPSARPYEREALLVNSEAHRFSLARHRKMVRKEKREKRKE